jgi:amino acid transporter
MPARKVKIAGLVATMFFIVSGGPFGLEDLVQSCGAWASCAILVATPLLWSMPTALLVGELAAALPEEGGYYAWVRRALGPFWGAQEAWLSLAASVFDMALYPTLFVDYAGRLFPALSQGRTPTLLGVAFVAACAAYNLLGAASVGNASRLQSAVVILPFVLLAGVCLSVRPSDSAVAAAAVPPVRHADAIGGLLVAMWNFMGWDNATTFAGEVEAPQRTFPRAVFAAVVLVTAVYLIPVAGVAVAHVDTSSWEAGAWADLARDRVGPWLSVAIVVAGCSSALMMFNSLVLSYSRLPVALANDGLLPRFFAGKLAKTGAPYVGILSCSLVWTLSLGLSFKRLVMLDILLYGLSLFLEFAALVVLRVREPGLARPFRVPGGLFGVIAIAVPPTLLIALSVVRTENEVLAGGLSALGFGAIIVAAGPVLYLAGAWRRRAARPGRRQSLPALESQSKPSTPGPVLAVMDARPGSLRPNTKENKP